MDPLVLLRLAFVIILLALCWQGVFSNCPYGFGPWFVGRFILWLDREGLHWRRGTRVR